MNQQRQFVENACDVVADAEKVDLPGQRPRGGLMKLVFELPRLFLAGKPLANDQPGKGSALTPCPSPGGEGTMSPSPLCRFLSKDEASLGKGRGQHVVSLAKRNLADRADQRHVSGSPSCRCR